MNLKKVSPVASNFYQETGLTKPGYPTATTNNTGVVSPMVTVESASMSDPPEKLATVVEAERPIRYDPVAIAEHYNQRPLQVWTRLLGIVWPFFNFATRLWWDKRRGRIPENEPKRAIQLRQILTKLGPAYIKIGQALSTRPDLVPPLYLEELTHLQDQLPPFPNEIAYQFIEEELGATPAEIYAELSPEPLAAASLGQVYKGKLKTGEVVAVKVQRPDLMQKIALDLYIGRQLAAWAKKNF